MNTSAKGSAYERAYKAELYRRGAKVVTRAAASRGPFDLLAVMPDAVVGVQCKSGYLSCAQAERDVEVLVKLVGDWPNCLPYIVHKTKEREFCEH